MRIELLGVPRHRAGIAELDIEADTLGQLLIALVARFRRWTISYVSTD